MTVARNIITKDRTEQMGVDAIRDIADKTNDFAGDGTTTAVVFGQEIFNRGIKAISMGDQPHAVRRGLEAACVFAVEELKKMSSKISSLKDLTHIAQISCKDTELGKLVAEVVNKTGGDGVVTVEDSGEFGTSYETVEGMKLDKGLLDSRLCTDVKKMVAVSENIDVLLYEKQLGSLNELMPFIAAMVKEKRTKLLIVAASYVGDIMPTIIENKLRGLFQSIVVEAPMFGDKQKDVLMDIAQITGARVVNSLWSDPKNVNLEILGKAKKVISGRKETVIVGTTKKSQMKGYITMLQTMMRAKDENIFEKKWLETRLARLSGGVAVVRVGYLTETEQAEKKLRIDDAIRASQCALQEGIVIGGGMVFWRVAGDIEKKIESLRPILDESELTGWKILRDTLRIPARLIMENAGHEPAGILSDISKSKNKNLGFNVSNGKIEDLLKSGIIDPVKVSRLALANAVSAASLLLLARVSVVELVEEDKDKDKKEK